MCGRRVEFAEAEEVLTERHPVVVHVLFPVKQIYMASQSRVREQPSSTSLRPAEKYERPPVRSTSLLTIDPRWVVGNSGADPLPHEAIFDRVE